MTRVLAASLLALVFTTAQGIAQDAAPKLDQLDFTGEVPGWGFGWKFGPFDPERPNEFTITDGTTTHTVQFGGPVVTDGGEQVVYAIAWLWNDAGYGYIQITVYNRLQNQYEFRGYYGPYTP